MDRSTLTTDIAANNYSIKTVATTAGTGKTFSTFHLSGIISSTLTDKNNNNQPSVNKPASNCILTFSCGLTTRTGNNSSSSRATTNQQQQQLLLPANATSNSNTTANSSYIIAGRWEMDVTNGNVEYFIVDFIMGLKDGTDMHVHSIENLKDIVTIPSSNTETGASSTAAPTSGKIMLSTSNNYSLSLYGSANILTNGNIQWKDVPLTINIFNGNVISIFPYPSYTNNHFRGSSIYGVVTLMTDAHYNQIRPSLWTY
jgi:hypothetical protein